MAGTMLEVMRWAGAVRIPFRSRVFAPQQQLAFAFGLYGRSSRVPVGRLSAERGRER
ncbi:MAG: hypothetical protein ACRDRE_02800 [Pseudonocardiaceae bacterium]